MAALKLPRAGCPDAPRRLRAEAGLVVLLALMGSVATAGEDDAPRVAFLGAWDRALPLIERASRETGIPVAVLRAADVLDEEARKRVTAYDVLYVLNLPTEETLPLVRALRRARRENPRLRIVALDHRDTQAELDRAGLLARDEKVARYWRANGLVNMRRLLGYTAVTYLGAEGEVEPPAAIQDYGYYHPASEEILSSFEELRSKVPWNKSAPVAALLIQQAFWVTGDTRVINAEIYALEREGISAAALFADTGARMRGMLRDLRPDLILEDRHGSFWEGEGKQTLLEELDVPYMRPISMLGYTIEEWLEDPRGLSYRDVGHFMTLQESRGTIEPIVVGGLKANIRGFKLHEPVFERLERMAKRASSWLRLRRKRNRQKRLAIVYYNKSLGKDDLLRGSPTGAFLDGPQSLVRFLPRLEQEGFAIDPLPKDAGELLAWIRERGRNVGPWAQGELEALADRGEAVLVPARRLETWLSKKLGDAHREALARHFGPPPGRLMVVTRNGQEHVVLPAIKLGNILLAPQPERGEKQDAKLLHSRDVPPPYNYLAFYWWLEEEFHADAVIHWGTHGTLELLPGKEAGLSKDDWSDLCAGTMPVINPWIMDNLGEATLSRRRSYALLVDHLVPPAVNAGLTDELRTIHDDIDKFHTLEAGLLREEFRRRIGEGVRKARLGETLDLPGLDGRKLSDAEVTAVATYLHEVYNSTTPTTLHVLGLPPREPRLVPYLVSILGRRFLDRLAGVVKVPEEEYLFEGDQYKWLRAQAEGLVRKTVLGGEDPPAALSKDITTTRDVLARLRRADDEIANVLRALQGGYVPPGPGPDPIRNPMSIPSGRNLYALNPEEIPTRPSWEVAVKLVDELLRTRRPRKVGIDLNGMNTMRDFGVMEGQVLYLMGVRPVWDANNLVVDVEVIPPEELQRPRVDVFIAMGGQYKENFPSRVRLLDKAIRLVSTLEEPDNYVRAGTTRMERQLGALGFRADRARLLAPARIFGTKPGNLSGTNILHLVPRSGVWENDDDIASVYIDNMSYVYTAKVWGEKVGNLYEESIQGTDTLLRVWASNMTSQLSNHHAYEYLGGLSMAVEKLTGRVADAFIADVRDPDGARIRGFEEVLATSLRTELLNRKWIEGMKEHDYAGAGMMAELVKNTFGWDVTRSGSVSDGVWNDIHATYVRDRYGLELRKWFEAENPHAFQEIAATMLEASRKGYWEAPKEVVAELSHIYAASVVRHGPSASLVSGGNEDLDAYVTRRLGAPGDAEAAAAFREAVARSGGATGDEERVRGPKLEETGGSEEQATPPSFAWRFLFAAAGLLVFGLGFWRRAGAPR